MLRRRQFVLVLGFTLGFTWSDRSCLAGETARIAPLPFPSVHANAVTFNDTIFLFDGGWTTGRKTEMMVLNTATGQWTHRKVFPKTSSPTASVIRDKIFVGPINFDNSMPATFWSEYFSYAVDRDSWTAAYPRNHGPGQPIAVGDRIFFQIADWVPPRRIGTNPELYDRIVVGELVAGKLIGRAGIVRKYAVYSTLGRPVVVGEKIYFINENMLIKDDIIPIFDTTLNTFSSGHPIPTPRVGFSAIAFKEKLYVIGGYPLERTGNTATTLVEIYDPKSNSWTSGVPLPVPRGDAAIAVLGDKIIVMGGQPRLNAPRDTILTFDSATQTWSISGQNTEPQAPPEPAVTLPKTAPLTFTSHSRRDDDYAIVVGVSEYQHLPRADFATNDAHDAVGAITSLGVPKDHIIELNDSHATRTELLKLLHAWLPGHVSAKSRIYFYYSGHGAPDIADASAYLMPWDADAEYVKLTGLSLTELYRTLENLPAEDIIVMLDSCFSGAGERSVLAPGLKPLVKIRAAKSARLTIFTAATGSETAGSSPEHGHGMFSYYLFEGLRGGADDEHSGHVTAEELHRYVKRAVVIGARKANRDQTPTLTTPSPHLQLY